MGLFSKKSSQSKPSLNGDAASSRKGSQTSLGSSLRSPTQNPYGNGSSGNLNGPVTPTSPLPPAITLPPPPDPRVDPVGYLRSLDSVREQSRHVMEAARHNNLTNFTVDMSKFRDVAEYVVSIIKRDHMGAYSAIPPHGRWQHFEVGGRKRLDMLLATWDANVDAEERTRRLLDLFLVSVLLDAGAGTKWCYKSKDSGKIYRRSEGLAVASLEMFKEGLFSSNPNQPHQVDGRALKLITPESLAQGLQVSATNPLDGLDGRASLLYKLGSALTNGRYFGNDQRPGRMLDFLLSSPETRSQAGKPVILVPTLWGVLMEGLAPIWPASRVQLGGQPLGDAWPCSTMPEPQQGWENIVPFHKLSQWLCYSLMVPISKLMGAIWAGDELLTGLPEYRNGGLLVDTGLLTLKDPQHKRGIEAYHANSKKMGQPNVEVAPMFSPDDDVIVEWRALTVQFLDMLLPEVNKLLGLSGRNALSLAQMLEAGTWKGGRELAEYSRPNTKEPPIMILSDGTVF